MINSKSIVILAGTVGVTLFTWEYVTLKKETKYKPSFALVKLANGSQYFFTRCGESLALISSFYKYIDFDDVKLTFRNLMNPLVKTVISWFYVCRGYYEYCGKNKLCTKIALAGTVTLLLSGYYGWSKYNMGVSSVLQRVLCSSKQKLLQFQQPSGIYWSE